MGGWNAWLALKRYQLADAIAELAASQKEADRLRKQRRRRWNRNRDRALKRDHHTCRMCPFVLCLEVHHVIPRAQGGPMYSTI
jgi:5-methylcytosine-specific restriction endonuclease McrA